MNENDIKEFEEIQKKHSYSDYTIERFCCGGDYCYGDHNGFIKSYINSLIARKEEEWMEEVKGSYIDMSKGENIAASSVNGEASEIWVNGWNAAIEEIIKINETKK